MHPDRTDIGYRYKADTQALPPNIQSAGTRNGVAVDITDYGSGTVVANVGPIGGGPTETSITYALQTSEDGTDGWVSLTDLDGNQFTTAGTPAAVTAANRCVELDFTLQYITRTHRFLRVVETVAFTGGTSPDVIAGATLVLGGGQRLPL
ncbi:hypothetical protein [Comamonas sp. JC664]|uniref:hypothetical protein n=1 Tax=Comamonas sp. JC664 TaxID=2801917 RepID=UPI00174C6F73|nr:hypothetical protein [Comamonas sp. JC664]MBL0698942.1 hypothetical protein [Comamonas sp. JC664]GHG79673.1 hypothetical protein GCM10012319_31770 [Comamonas sp. KCTC 72670]